MPAPVMMPIKKLGTTLATAIIKLSTHATQANSMSTKKRKWSQPGWSCTMK